MTLIPLYLWIKAILRMLQNIPIIVSQDKSQYVKHNKSPRSKNKEKSIDQIISLFEHQHVYIDYLIGLCKCDRVTLQADIYLKLQSI